MSVTNPAPSKITDWSVESAIRSFVVSIPARPVDNDLAGIIVIAKEGTGQTPVYPDDVFYRGPWSDLITVTTDANNNQLPPNTNYTVKVAAFDEFGTDSLTFSDPLEVLTFQLITVDIGDGAVSGDKIADAAVSTVKLANLAVSTAKIDALAVTSGKIADLAVDTLKIADEAVSIVTRSNQYDFNNTTPSFTFNYDMPEDGVVMFIAIMIPQGDAGTNSQFNVDFFADGSTTRFDYIEQWGYIAPAVKTISNVGTRSAGTGYSIKIDCELVNMPADSNGNQGARVDFILFRRFK